MLKIVTSILIFFTAVLTNVVSLSHAEEMSSDNFILSISVMDTTGASKNSTNFSILDAVGQSTPIGPSQSDNFILEAGFLYGTFFSMSFDETIGNVIDALNDILNDPSLTNKERKKIEKAKKKLEDALDAWALYKAGDPKKLTKTLKKTKDAIKKLIASGLDTAVYQKMLAQASELIVRTEINAIASIAGESDPNIIQARILLSDGSTEMLNTLYKEALKSFKKAFKKALKAV